MENSPDRHRVPHGPRLDRKRKKTTAALSWPSLRLSQSLVPYSYEKKVKGQESDRFRQTMQSQAARRCLQRLAAPSSSSASLPRLAPKINGLAYIPICPSIGKRMAWPIPHRVATLSSNYTSTPTTIAAASFSTTPTLLDTKRPSRPKPPPDEEFTETYVKGTGPGGQKIVRLCCVHRHCPKRHSPNYMLTCG